MPLLHYCAQLGILSSNLVKMLAHQLDEEYLGQLAVEFGEIILLLVMAYHWGYRVFFSNCKWEQGVSLTSHGESLRLQHTQAL